MNAHTLYNYPTRRALVAGAIPIIGSLSPVAHAALPTLQDPSRGAGNGILQTIQNYGYDIVMLVALLVIAAMFVGVCYHAYNTYSEIHVGRKTWGEFGLTVAVGALLLVVGIYLLNNATGVL